VTDNTSCLLTITSFVADQHYAANPPFVLTTSYQAAATAFFPASDAGAGVAFYGNAKLSSNNFGNNFVLSVLGSANASSASGTVAATYLAMSATSLTVGSPVPNDTLNAAGSSLALQVSAKGIVQSASGSAAFIAGTTPGVGYVIVQGSLASNPSFGVVNNAYKNGSPTSISGSFSVPAASFALVGKTVSTQDTVIVATSGGKGYQVFTITFNAPT
jgi:hypothetical protein